LAPPATTAWSAWQQKPSEADATSGSAANDDAAAPPASVDAEPLVSPFSMIQSDFPTTPSSVFGNNADWQLEVFLFVGARAP
jgi:hypothetical protein